MEQKAPSYTSMIAAYYHSFAQKDFPFLLDLMHPDIEFRSAENFIYADHNPYRGKDGVKDLITRLTADWEIFDMQPEEITGAGDMVIARGRYKGKFRHTGFLLDAEFVHVFKFRDGRIVLQHNYTDTAQFRDAVVRGVDPVTAQ
jgi:ketosteroid isomerase-like protein